MKASEIFKQYIWLTDTIYRSGGISLKELNDRWIRTEMSGGLPMTRATFNRHKEAIEEIFDLCIECRRKGGYRKRRSIEKQQITTLDARFTLYQ